MSSNDVLLVTTILLILLQGKGGSTDREKPEFLTQPSTYRVPVSGVARLECRVRNLGDYLQVWKNGTRVISVGSLQSLSQSQIRLDPRITRTEESLVVRNVTTSDTGSYTCEVEADLENHFTVTHFLQVLVSPRLKERTGPGSLRVRQGSTVTLSCRADGHPTPGVTWSRSQPGGRFVLISSGPELTLEKVAREVAGTYNCRADNGVGTPQYRTFQLRVSYPPLVTGSGVQHASPGWVVSVWCRVLADPSPSLAWYRDDTGNILTTQLQPTEREADGAAVFRLELTPRSQSEITNYSCRATNSLGHSSATVQLTGRPSAPVISSGELSAGRTSHLLTWATLSGPDITAYNLLVRQLPSGTIVFAWDSLLLEENLARERDRTGRLTVQSWTLVGLKPDTAYVAKVKARNALGWSDFSSERVFYTRGKESSPVEGRVLESGEVSRSSGPLISVLSVLITSLVFISSPVMLCSIDGSV